MLQKSVNYAVRRCMGMDVFNMKEHRVSDEMMYRAVRWETVEDLICRHTMFWLGHVARMPVWRRPKQVMFGWVAETAARTGTRGALMNSWYNTVIESADVSTMDWFRQAQDRKGWKRTVSQAFPQMRMD